MGQFLAVCSRHTADARQWLELGVRTANALFERAPSLVRQFGLTGVASFERRAHEGASGRLHTFTEQNTWCLPAGTWVHQDGTGPDSTFPRIATALTWSGNPEAALAEIDGTYCLIFGQQAGTSIHIVTDPIGQLHVYALYVADTALVSTSALLLAQLGRCDWDTLGVREFLAKGTIFEDRSLFSHVRKIGPGSILTFESGTNTNTRRFWSFQDHVETASTKMESLENFVEAVESGLKSVFNTFGEPVLDLTGGFDSRILLACVRRVTADGGFNTVVVGSTNDPDVMSANRIATRFDLLHQQINSQPGTARHWWTQAQAAVALVDGEYDILEYTRILNVHRQLAARFGISINGSGGELIRGYWWELLFPRTGSRDRFDPYRIALRRFATDPWAESLLTMQYPDTLAEHFAEAIVRTTGTLVAHRNTACLDNVYLMLRMQRWQGRIASATNRIWPCVSPLLFRRPIEIAIAAPIALRRNGRMARRILARLDYELARLPMAEGYPAAPLTLRTLPYFLPRATELTGRAVRRLANGRRTEGKTAYQGHIAMRSLLACEEVAEMLDPARMLTAEFYEPEKLRAEIHKVITLQAPAAHVGRLITLESVARLRANLLRTVSQADNYSETNHYTQKP